MSQIHAGTYLISNPPVGYVKELNSAVVVDSDGPPDQWSLYNTEDGYVIVNLRTKSTLVAKDEKVVAVPALPSASPGGPPPNGTAWRIPPTPPMIDLTKSFLSWTNVNGQIALKDPTTQAVGTQTFTVIPILDD